MAYESELEAELEDEYEGELEDESEYELEDEMEMEDEAGLEGEGWLGALGNIAGSLLGESEDEYEGEDEYEDEDEEELSPIRKIYPDAVMEHLGELAAESESEDEAAKHLAPLVHMAASKLLPVMAKVMKPTAKKAIPKMARAVTKATPHLTKGIVKVAKALHRNAQTRHLLKAVPGIARRVVGNIAHKVARGGHVSPHAAVRTLAHQTRRVLGTPAHRKQALRRHNHLERKFHGGGGVRGIGRPHVRYGGARYGRGRRGVARRHGRPIYRAGGVRYGRPGVVRGAAPGVRYVGGGAPGVAGRTGVRTGQVVGGQCSCPSCGTASGATPAPAYCRCCGQVIR